MERYRTTIVLGAVLIVLAAAAFLLNGQKAASPGTPTPVPVTYVWEETNPVKAIDIVSGTGKISLVKDVTTGNWTITAPVQQPAELYQVSGVADSLQRLQSQFPITGTTDLAQYGLTGSPMQVTATFSDTAGTKRVLLIGSPTTDLSGYYVKPQEGSTVYVVQNTYIEPLRTWLITPPIQPPTPTPEPATPTPATTATPAGGEGATTPGSAITTTTEITGTSPGAANPTTPLPAPATP